MGSGHKIGLTQMTETARNPAFFSFFPLLQAPLNGDLGLLTPIYSSAFCRLHVLHSHFDPSRSSLPSQLSTPDVTQPGFCPSSHTHTPRNVGHSTDFPSLALLLSHFSHLSLSPIFSTQTSCDTSRRSWEICCPQHSNAVFIASRKHSTLPLPPLCTLHASRQNHQLLLPSCPNTPHFKLQYPPHLPALLLVHLPDWQESPLSHLRKHAPSNNHVFLYSCWGQPRQVSLSFCEPPVSLTMDISPCSAGLRCPCSCLVLHSIN